MTRSFEKNLVGRSVPGDKLEVITNGVDTARFRPAPREQALVAELGMTLPKVILINRTDWFAALQALESQCDYPVCELDNGTEG